MRLEEQNFAICKKFFLKIFQISWGRLYRCLMKDEISNVIDMRGRHEPGNKLDITDVLAHIKSFPSYSSHYSRKDNQARKYLHPELTIHKMYSLYLEKCQLENKTPGKEKFYNKIFTTKFNLHFKHPKSDTCRLCDELHLKINSENDEIIKQGFLTQKELHLRKAEKARESLNSDKDKASTDVYCSSFDLQKALPFPKLSTSIAYYKRNLYMYNLGIHSFNTGVGHMYVWNETQGGRGSQDISSIVRKHLIQYASTHKHIILYSDACGGQNRNIKMALTLLKLVQSNEIQADIIDFKFMVSGHSYLPNDREFGIIEAAS